MRTLLKKLVKSAGAWGGAMGVAALCSTACGSGTSVETTEGLGTTSQAFNPSAVPGAQKGHVLITQKAIELLKARNLLSPLLDSRVSAVDAAKNIALVVYGNNFGDRSDAGWPDVNFIGSPPTRSVPNRMAAQIPASGPLVLDSKSSHSDFSFPVGYLQWATVNTDVTAKIHWVAGRAGFEAASAAIRLEIDAVISTDTTADTPIYQFGPGDSGKPLSYTIDNLYHYGHGDLRDFDDPALTNGDMQIRAYPFLPEHITQTDRQNVKERLAYELENQALVTGSDYGVAKYGAILFQFARKFFPNGSQPAPQLANLIKTGNDVPGWHTGWLLGHGHQDTLVLSFPHTYLGGMPYVCANANPSSSADPCAFGQPTWPVWILDQDTPPTTDDLWRLEQASPPRSNRAALIYLGWATHMMQDASLPHHVAGWSGQEHQYQDDYGDQPWYYQDYSQYANATITTTQCSFPCNCPPGSGLGPCLANCQQVCFPVTKPDPRAAYAPYSPWWIDPYMAAEVDALFGPSYAPKTRAEICQGLGLTDEPPGGDALNWEAAYPVFLSNAKKAYYARQPVLRGDAALAAGREYVKNAVIGTAKLLLCAIPNGSNIPAASAPAARAGLHEHVSFGGRVQKVAPGMYDAWWSGPHSLRSIGNDATSSVSLPTGYQVTLFDQVGGVGANRLFTSSSDVGTFNDVTSSVFVTKDGESGTFFIKLKRDWIDDYLHRDYGFDRYLQASSDWVGSVTSTAFSPNARQQWRYDPGSRALVNGNGLCLDIPNGSSANGTGLQVYPCNSGLNQQWQLTADGQILNANGKCLSAITNGAADLTQGLQVTLSDCNVLEGQAFDFRYECQHDPCRTGSALSASCSPDVAAVCEQDSYCCGATWDSNCVDRLPQKCQWYGDRPRGNPVHRSSDCGTFWTDQGLVPGQSVTSCDGRFRLVFGQDGNLVLSQEISFYPAAGGISVLLWQTGPTTSTPGMLIMQNDGHLVIYDSAGAFRWGTWTNGNWWARAVVQDDGNFVIYDVNGAPVWASNTCCH